MRFALWQIVAGNLIREFSSIAVIVLTVRSDELEKVRLLDAGANDYLTKPFGLQELLARIRVLLRKKPDTTENTCHIYDDGYLHVNLQARVIQVEGCEIQLTRKEFSLFELLIQNAGKTLTQPQLLKAVWGATHIEDTHYLRIAVSKIRSKIGDDPVDPRYILTETGVGLRFRPVEGWSKP